MRVLSPTRIILAILLLDSAMPWLLGQELPKAGEIKAETSNVVVDLIVTDRHGRHVPGLTATDFAIYEDGVPQKILSFSPPASATPLPGGGIAEQKGQAKADQTSLPAPRELHFLTVVLDLADNRPANTKNSADAVLGYLEKTVTTNDYVAIYYIDRSLHLALPFTNSLAQAREILKGLEKRPSGTFSGSDRNEIENEINDLYRQVHPESQLGAVAGDQAAVANDRSALSTGPMNNMAMLLDRQIDTLRGYLTMQNMFQARAIFAALRAICVAYSDMPGRKNVVLFSEGFLYSNDVRPEMEAVADAANRANVALYVIDPTGVEVNPYGAGSRPTDTIGAQMAAIGAQGAPKPGGNRGGQTKFDKMKAVGEVSRGEQLEWLADTTGGFLVKNTNDLLPAFNKVLDDSRDFYTLVYRPENRSYDGKFRSIKVELQQRGYQLRYRRGYWAIPRGQAVAMTPAAAQLLTGLERGSLRASFAPEVHANLLLAPDSHYSVPVAVSVPGNRIPLEKDGEVYKTRLTMILVARDTQGKILSVSQRGWSIGLNHKEREDFEKTTLTLHGQVPIADLQHLAMEAVLQMPGNSLAVGGTEITVPEPAISGLRLTSILLSNRAEQAACSDSSDPLCFQNVRLYQPARPQFPPSGRLIVYFAASQLALDPQTKRPRMGVVFTLMSGKDVVKNPVAENVQALPGPAPNSVMVLAEYDLKSLPAGSYSLRAITQDFVGHASSSQQTQFVVQ